LFISSILKKKKNSSMPSNGGFVPDVIKKALSLQTKDQAGVLDRNYSPLNAWSADIPTASP
jgi:hypothetical protein